MKTNGMQAAGYEYINVDGGWWAGSDTGTIGRNASGYFDYNHQKYPHGIKAVADYIHSKGFKYGHYTDAGKTACNRDAPMSEGYEHQDAFLFALEYGADMVKVDACADTLPALTLMTRWQQQLNKTGRPVLFSNCHNGCETDRRQNISDPGGWLPWCAELSNMWRSSADINAHWPSIMHNLDSLKGRGKVAGPGHWNDPDFLEVGVEGMALTPTSSQQNLDENVAHMTMWCITSSPLIAGLRMAPGGPGGGSANQTALDILTSKAAIAINQQYCDPSDCGIANGGDLLTELQKEAGVLEPPLAAATLLQTHAHVEEALPPRPYMTLGECDGTANWQVTPYNGTKIAGASFICGPLQKGPCFNMQDCSSSVIYYGSQTTTGCEDGTNTLFEITSAGQLVTRMKGPLSGQCLIPVHVPAKQGGGVRLEASPCAAARGQKWSHDDKTQELVWTSADNVKCVHVHAKAPGPPPGPPPTPGVPETWAKPLPGKEAAIAFLNRDSEPAAFALALADIPWLVRGVSSCDAHDVWADTRSKVSGSIKYAAVRSHQAIFLRLSNCQ